MVAYYSRFTDNIDTGAFSDVIPNAHASGYAFGILLFIESIIGSSLNIAL